MENHVHFRVCSSGHPDGGGKFRETMGLFGKSLDQRAVEALERIAAALELSVGQRQSTLPAEDATEIMYIDDEATYREELKKDLYFIRTGIRLKEDEPVPSVPAREFDELG